MGVFGAILVLFRAIEAILGPLWGSLGLFGDNGGRRGAIRGAGGGMEVGFGGGGGGFRLPMRTFGDRFRRRGGDGG